MKRLFIVYNPRSSHYAQVKKDIIEKLKGLKGVMIGKFEVAPTNVDDNAKRLAKVLSSGDLVIAAGGDGTANIAVNGIMLSRAQNVKFGVIGYGNFNLFLTAVVFFIFINYNFDVCLIDDNRLNAVFGLVEFAGFDGNIMISCIHISPSLTIHFIVINSQYSVFIGCITNSGDNCDSATADTTYADCTGYYSVF